MITLMILSFLIVIGPVFYRIRKEKIKQAKAEADERVRGAAFRAELRQKEAEKMKADRLAREAWLSDWNKTISEIKQLQAIKKERSVQ